jgi:hypothetical protein
MTGSNGTLYMGVSRNVRSRARESGRRYHLIFLVSDILREDKLDIPPSKFSLVAARALILVCCKPHVRTRM